MLTRLPFLLRAPLDLIDVTAAALLLALATEAAAAKARRRLAPRSADATDDAVRRTLREQGRVVAHFLQHGNCCQR